MGDSSRARVRVEDEPGGVLGVWLDRPDKRNAIDGAMVDELLDVFSAGAARPVVLGSSDARCFCAGADLDLADADRAVVSDRLYELYERMVRFPAPIVAVVDGPAVGGGAQLAVASDLRVAGRGASLRFAGPGHGLAVGAWVLPGLVGRGRAVDLALTMRAVAADEALALGLVDRVVDDARAVALDLASGFAGLDADAVARVKSITHLASGTLDALAEERRGNRAVWSGSVAGLRPPG